jgi:FAD/FMN-containing dehydrogenase
LLGPRGFTAIPTWSTPVADRLARPLHRPRTGHGIARRHAEVAALVRLCGEHGVPIVPQGGNSGMSGGATPDDSGGALLLSLRRMNAIRGIDTAARQVTCEAGVVLQTLHEAAEAEGLRFPLTLGGKGSATVGGLISTNAGGTQVLRHGSMRAQVLGLEAVLADGSIYDSADPAEEGQSRLRSQAVADRIGRHAGHRHRRDAAAGAGSGGARS